MDTSTQRKDDFGPQAQPQGRGIFSLMNRGDKPAGGAIAARVGSYRERMEALVTASIRSESRAVEPLSVAIFGAAEALGRWWLRTGELSAERTAELLIRTIEPGLRMR